MTRYSLAVARLLGAITLMSAIAGPAYAECHHPEAFGALADGKRDDTASIQSAVQAAIDARFRGGSVCLAAGDYRITRSIVISDVQGIRFVGDGGSTRLIWDGDDRSPLLLLNSVQDGEFRTFQIIADTHPLDVGIQLVTGIGATLVSRHNMFVDVRINGIVSGIRTGVRIGGGGTDANNDFHLFENVTVANYRDVAFSLENTQVYGTMFLNWVLQQNLWVTSGSGRSASVWYKAISTQR